MKQNYLLDAENLVFQKDQNSFKSKVKRALRYFYMGGFLAFIFWIILFSGLINSPKSIIMHNTNNELVAQLSNVNSKFDSISNLLSHVQHKDDNLYRVVSEIDPISPSERQAGFGGTDKYKNLQGFSNSEILIESAKKSDILKNQLKVQYESYSTVYSCVRLKNDSLLSIPAISPIAPIDFYRISDKFGMRVHPITRKIHKHTGIDMAANIGKPIHSVGKGKVINVRKSKYGYGNNVIIDHGFGFKTLYAHMNTIYVKKGDQVLRGEQIGTVGNTGSSTGPHLHYEVIYKHHKINPETYFIEDLTNREYLNMVNAFASSN
ncbi:MAG: M23 family metallopeptidase [Salinivirgaceae bacterium]|nr:M23 family metallopeptidase [Salinivirgaceae bacterium]